MARAVVTSAVAVKGWAVAATAASAKPAAQAIQVAGFRLTAAETNLAGKVRLRRQ